MSASHFTEHFVISSKNSIAEGATLDIEELTDINAPGADGIFIESIDIDD